VRFTDHDLQHPSMYCVSVEVNGVQENSGMHQPVEDWLFGLIKLAHKITPPENLVEAALDARSLEDPEDYVQLLEGLFDGTVLSSSFNQFNNPSSFFLQPNLPLSQVVAAGHLNTPHDTLHQLARIGNPYVTWTLAANPVTPSKLLQDLYDSDLVIEEIIDGDETVFERWNFPGWEDPSTCSEFENLTMRVAVASNPNLSEDLLANIISKGNDLELVALSGRLQSNLDQSDSTVLVESQWEALFNRAVSSETGAFTWGRLLCLRPTWPIDLCCRLMSTGQNFNLSEFARGVIGCSNSCPEEIIRELATSTEVRSRWAAASNRSAPLDILLALALDKDELVRQAVIDNPSAQPIPSH